MTERTRVVLVIGALTVLIAAVGASIFALGNTQVGVYVVVGGIPIVLVGSAVAYVRGVVGDEGSTGQYVEQRSKQVGELLRDVWRSLSTIEAQHEGFDASQLRARAESLATDYESQGNDFDRDQGSFNVGRKAAKADLQELERIDDELREIAADRDEALYDFVTTELAALESDLVDVADAGVASEPATYENPPTPSEGVASGVDYHDVVADPLDAYRAEADDIIEAAISRVREIRRSAASPIDEQAVDSRLESATDALDRVDYTTAVNDVLEARSELESELSGSFDEDRTDLLSLADVILASDADRFTSIEPFDEVREVKRELEGLDSALDVEVLTRHQQTMRSAALSIVESVQSELDQGIRTLDAESLPSGYYTRPAVADEDFVRTFDSIDAISDLEGAWREHVPDLVDAVEEVDTKATVIEAYPDIAGTIDEALQRNGTVTGDDLPVRNAEKFFGLYFRRQPDVEFDPEVPALHRGDTESYALEVTVSFDEGSETKRRAAVTVSADGFDAHETVETHLAGSVTFEEVPFGEYALHVEPEEDDYAVVERTVQVEGDTTESVSVESMSLYDQLVGDHQAEIEAQVGEFGPRLAERFEEADYLSTEMDFPITPEYVPGLLAAWANEEGYAIARGDGIIYVYDGEQLSREIMNVIKYNIDDGETIPYERIRSNYLSTPVPDDVIADLATSTGLAVEPADRGLAKVPGGDD